MKPQPTPELDRLMYDSFGVYNERWNQETWSAFVNVTEGMTFHVSQRLRTLLLDASDHLCGNPYYPLALFELFSVIALIEPPCKQRELLQAAVKHLDNFVDKDDNTDQEKGEQPSE